MLKDLSEVYMLEGYKCLSNKKINSAILHLEKSILFDNNNWQAMNLIGLCFYTLARFEEAKVIWKKSFAINSKENNRAFYYSEKLEEDEFKAICSSYNEALENAKEGQYKKADKMLDEEILLKSNIVPFIKFKGLCKLAVGNNPQAISLWKKTLDINKEDMETIKYISNSIDSNINRRSIFNLFQSIFRRKESE